MSLHTTTVRFTTDQWASIVDEARRLGIARSALIRDAVIAHVGDRRTEDRIGMLEARVEALETRSDSLARIVRAAINPATTAAK